MAMLTLDASYPSSSFDFPSSAVKPSGLRRLLAAAVVSDQFRQVLLSEPEVAMAGGYLGQPFILTDKERTIIRNVRAKNLTDFAQKVNQALKSD